MEAIELLQRSLEQSQSLLDRTLDGLAQEESTWSPGPECNSIAFILWHMTRAEDFFVLRLIQRETELYEAEGWRERLSTPANESGFEYTTEQLQAWPAPKLEVLREYANAVRAKTLAFVRSASTESLSELVRPDRPPDTVGIILGRISTEIALHVGQIAYLRGIQRGLDK